MILACTFFFWGNGISTVFSWLSSAPNQYLSVARQGFSCFLWEGGRTSFSFIHLLWIPQSPCNRPSQVSQVKNYHPNSGGMTQTLFRCPASPRSKAGCLRQWVTPGVGDTCDCIQSSHRQPWIHSGPLLRGKHQQVMVPLGLVPSARDALFWPEVLERNE